MTSFINMLANDIWSDADITRRTEAMVRSEFSLEAETILNRKVVAMSIGEYQPTGQDLEDMARFRQVVEAAQAEGAAARVDMALLLQVFPLEDAQRRLDKLPPAEDASEEEKALDADERVAAQAVIDEAPQDVRDLFEARRAT